MRPQCLLPVLVHCVTRFGFRGPLPGLRTAAAYRQLGQPSRDPAARRQALPSGRTTPRILQRLA